MGGRAAVGRAASSLGGFATAVGSRGLDAGLDVLGLGELRGRPATEVVARIAEHLATGVEGLQGDLLRIALQDTLLEAAALEGETGYENLSDALQSFLDREGVEGLVESFLTHYIFDRIWAYVQAHVERRSAGQRIRPRSRPRSRTDAGAMSGPSSTISSRRAASAGRTGLAREANRSGKR